MPSWCCIKKQAYAFSKYNPASRDASLTHPEGSPGPAAASGTQAMDIEKVNSMDFGEFVDVFGNVVERCPLIAAAVRSQCPFSDLEDLEQHFFAFTDALPQSGKALVLDTEILNRGISDMLIKKNWGGGSCGFFFSF